MARRRREMSDRNEEARLMEWVFRLPASDREYVLGLVGPVGDVRGLQDDKPVQSRMAQARMSECNCNGNNVTKGE